MSQAVVIARLHTFNWLEPPSLTRPIIHLTAVGGPAGGAIACLGVRSLRGMTDMVQQAVGERYRVRAGASLRLMKLRVKQGGRVDDRRRAREIQHALADDNVAALVAIRGGAWFTRILPMIDFDVLSRRRRPIFVFGFSEMTTLIALASRYRRAVALYDLCPGFLLAGMRRYAELNAGRLARSLKLPKEQYPGFAAGWALARYPTAFGGFFREVVDVIEGRGTRRQPTGRLVHGRIPVRSRITIVGGNLSVMMPLLGSAYSDAIETCGKWLAIEDVNEAPDRIDRMLAAIKLAGLFKRCAGVIIGDFHDENGDQRETVLRTLRLHLPPKRATPIISLRNFGHAWPIAPVPMGRRVTLLRGIARGGAKPPVKLEIPWKSWGRPS